MKRNYTAIDLEIAGIRYKLIRISYSNDGSFYITPEIKDFMGKTINGKITDLHFSNHSSGINHLRIRDIKTDTYQIPQITLMGKKECRWYLCLNLKNKQLGDILNINNKKDFKYSSYELLKIKQIPTNWLTLFLQASKGTMDINKIPLRILGYIKLYYNELNIYITLCEGKVKKSQKPFGLKSDRILPTNFQD